MWLLAVAVQQVTGNQARPGFFRPGYIRRSAGGAGQQHSILLQVLNQP
jgi:hypothetical protein